MRTLSLNDIQQVTGAALNVKGCQVQILNDGIPDNYFATIESVYQQIFDNIITTEQSAALLADVPIEYLQTYAKNIEKALIL
jgi:hypothetical protein